MNHQPFEDWLLSEDPLSPEDKESLDLHLKTCKQCSELLSAWHGVKSLIVEAPAAEPKPGFVDRWSSRLEVEKQLDRVVRHRWQSVIMLILFANVITGLVILLGTQFFTSIESPISLVLSGISRLVSTVALLNAIQNISGLLLGTILDIVPVGIWALIGLGLIGSIVTWIVSITSLSMLPRRM